MEQWWAAIPAFEKLFWVIALPTTLVSVLQILLSVLGAGDMDVHGDVGDIGDIGDIGDVGHVGDIGDVGHGDAGDVGDAHDGGHDSDSSSSFRVFTLRNLIIMGALFGWTGIAGSQYGLPKAVTVILAFVFAMIGALIVAGIFYLVMQMQSSGTMKIDNAVNAVGTVYLPIPAEKAGMGRVQVPVQGSLRELGAMTAGPKLKTGEKIKVVSVIDKETLLVQKL